MCAFSFIEKKLFWVQPPCHTHESHWHFEILQIESNVFFVVVFFLFKLC